MGVELTAGALEYYLEQINRVSDRALDNLHIAPIHISHGNGCQWVVGDKHIGIANHAKLYIIDDRAFYVGSDNFYPCSFQEFGFLIQDPAATGRLLKEYWNKLWKYSADHEYPVPRPTR